MVKRIIFFAFILLFLNQSCVVYQKRAVPINQAVNQGKVKIMLESGQVYKFTNIEVRDSVYYGKGREYLDQYTYVVHDEASTPIDSTMIKFIYIKDVKKSKRKTVWLVVGLSLPVAYIVLGSLVFIFGGF